MKTLVGGDGISDQLGIIQFWPISVNDEFVLFGVKTNQIMLNCGELMELKMALIWSKKLTKLIQSACFFFPLDEERVLFSAQLRRRFELWISDGTEAGTNAVGNAYSVAIVCFAIY